MKMVKLEDIANYSSDKKVANPIYYVSTKNIKANKRGVYFPCPSIPKAKSYSSYKKGDILVSNIRPYFKKIWLADCNGTRSNDILDIHVTSSKIFQQYLYYVLLSNTFFRYMTKVSNGTKMPRSNKKAVMKYKIPLPSLSQQKQFINLFSKIDNRINSNKVINIKLIKLVSNLFIKWNRTSKSKNTTSLDNIATYTNGVAIKKYPPKDVYHSLPALKIKELKQGFIDRKSDHVSSNIKPSVIINNGDVIFSWSATLMLKIWNGGKVGLNQHLFKVTSNKYPKWFYYLWTLHYLNKFQRIAKDKATTMGHIKRKDLNKSKIKLPTSNEWNNLNKIFIPIFKYIVNTKKESYSLLNLRHNLLLKYFS